MENTLLICTVICLCFAVSFVLSGMEAGVFALNPLRIRQKTRAGDQRAKLLLSYLENPENFLWTILIGNTLANFLMVGLVLTSMYYWMPNYAGLLLAALAAFIFLLYALGDLLPKLLFQRMPNRLCLMLARPFRFIHLGLTPLVAMVRYLSSLLLHWTGGKAFTGWMFGNREELRLVMQESSSGFTSEERAMINRVLDLQSARLRQIIMPMDKTVTVTADTPMSQVLELCKERNLTRLPVWQTIGPTRRIAGLVSLKSLLYSTDLDLAKSAGDYVKPALYLAEEMRLEEALRRMQRSGQRMAIVLDRNRRELGLVCLQDILKAVFGEISL